jgi:hypothetical protein
LSELSPSPSPRHAVAPPVVHGRPAGPASWDVALTASRPDWRVKARRGDVIKLSGTYDVSRASWWESMAIMFVARYAGTDAGGVDPFAGRLDRAGLVTHGHLAENDNHGGGKPTLPDARSLPGRPAPAAIALTGFLSSRGDLNNSEKLPTIRRGQALTFVNKDAPRNIFHTITGCRAPCSGTAGIALPRAPVHARWIPRDPVVRGAVLAAEPHDRQGAPTLGPALAAALSPMTTLARRPSGAAPSALRQQRGPLAW